MAVALCAAAIVVLASGCAATASPETRAEASPDATTTAAGQDGGSDGGPAGDERPGASEEHPANALDGMTIAVDPGHNGGNAANPGQVNAQVPDGRGGQKACNTTGTATNDGWPEHAFTWELAQLLREEFQQHGAEVVLSRENDEGVGPCVDERGQFAGDADADALLSLHANGSESASAQGFHVIVSDPPLNEAQGEPSVELARTLVTALEYAGRPINTAYGADGISRRPDLAGLNHAEVPAVILELGEMRNAEEAAFLRSEEGQKILALSIVEGLTEWAAASVAAGEEQAQEGSVGRP